MYKQSIILFGIVIPIVIAAVLIGACAFVRGKITASFDEKVLYYSGYENSRLGALAIEAQISRQREDYVRWNELLEQETFSLVTTNLRAIGETLPPKEFQQTAFDGDYILTTIPTDDLFPVIELRFNTRWRIEFKQILKNTSFFSSLLNPLSTETSFRIDENSEEEDASKILFLNLDHFLNDSTTLRGAQIFQHDFHLFRNKREFSMRFRFLERDLLSQFSSGLETGYGKERSVRLRFKMIKEINNETEYINKIDDVMSEGNATRNRQLSSDEILTDFSYRPLNHIEFGFKISVGRTTDYFPEKPTIIDNNLVALRFTWSFAGRGLLRIEAERDELTAENSDNYIPFEMTRGKTIGNNYTWRLNFDYKFASLLQVNFNYNGRLQGSGDLVHGLGAEARAYF